MKNRTNKDQIINAFKNSITKRKLASAYMRGEISINELEKHGINLSKPE